MDRSVIFQAFVDKWTHPDYRPKPVESSSVDLCAEKLKVVFPSSYYEYLTSFGSGGTTRELLDSIVEDEVEINDLSEVFTPDELIESTDAWRGAGMPKDLIAFASDCMGNMFCFKSSEIVIAKDDSPIWFFDHDFVTVEKIQDSFTSWIYEFVKIEKLDA
ncbi:MAG: SMI1/KNR4 family protein [Candidatus Thiodiazotropha sp. (ex Monitilora ramsayi)]|nr:SMI1/KNR4 family protein [Candidatus Thiodiazotropha sp. (ex Monitilora ramsayi)]